MSILNDIFVSMPASGDNSPVLVAKIQAPDNGAIGWETKVRFEDGVLCFVTVDRKPLPLQSGRTIEECYTAYTSKKLGFFGRDRGTQFAIYAYRTVLDGCVVGTRFPFVDRADGCEKVLMTFWNYSISPVIPENLISEVTNAPGGIITAFSCCEIFRKHGNLHGILEQVISEQLRKVPFNEIRSCVADISDNVKNRFRASGVASSMGLDIVSFTLGDIKIAE